MIDRDELWKAIQKKVDEFDFKQMSTDDPIEKATYKGAIKALYAFNEILVDTGVAKFKKDETEEAEHPFKTGDYVIYLNDIYQLEDDGKHYILTSMRLDASVPIVHMDYGDEDFKLRLATEEEIQQVKNPKFKEDDWIVYDGWITQIVDVKHDGYVNSNNDFIPKNREDSMRLWDIKDAKPGDVLSWDHERYTIIFKELKDSNIIAHCSYNNHAEYFSTNSCAYDTIFDSTLRFCPASEHAKKVLFEKIKEAGYEWDVKTKELKKTDKEDKTLSEFEDKLAAACLMFGACPEEDRTDYIKDCAKTLMSIARKEITNEIDKYKMEEDFIDKAEERFKFDSYFYRCGIEDTLNIIEKK